MATTANQQLFQGLKINSNFFARLKFLWKSQMCAPNKGFEGELISLQLNTHTHTLYLVCIQGIAKGQLRVRLCSPALIF